MNKTSNLKHSSEHETFLSRLSNTTLHCSKPLRWVYEESKLKCKNQCVKTLGLYKSCNCTSERCHIHCVVYFLTLQTLGGRLTGSCVCGVSPLNATRITVTVRERHGGWGTVRERHGGVVWFPQHLQSHDHQNNELYFWATSSNTVTPNRSTRKFVDSR